MKILHSFLSLAAVLSISLVNAQTVDEIISKHLEAIGGKEKLAAINSVKMENIFEIMGNDAPSTTVIVNGKGYRSETEFNGQKSIQVYTDKSGWAINPMAGSSEPQAMPDEQYKSGVEQIYIVPFLDYAARGNKAELLGQEKLGDANTYKIKLTGKDGSATTYFIDAASYYILKTEKTAEMMGQQMQVTANFSDYKKTDYGWVIAQNLVISFGDQFSMTGKTGKIEINPQVNLASFEMSR